ncbi:hypothetical protein Tco_0647621 [Tanacetum coccineum]
MVSSDEASLGDQEDASKQGRKINDIDADAEVTLVVVESEVAINAEKTRSVVEETVNAAATTITASSRPKAKEIVIHEQKQAPTPKVSSQQLSQVKVQDKGKGIMVEEPMKLKKKDQISLDEELAFKLQAEEDELERLAREKAQQVKEANIVWDDVQAKIDADNHLAKRLQDEEQDPLTDAEKAKLFMQLLEARKKHFETMRAQEKRSKSPTKTQKRNIMSTYLKNMAGYKTNQLNNKSFDDIQKLFDKAMKRVNTFVDMDTKLVEGSAVRAKESSKRAGEDLQQESTKKQKIDDDKETAELQSLMEVIPDEEEVAFDDIPLATKPSSIIDWKILKEGKIMYFQIIRAGGSSKRYSAFIQMLKSFDKEDLETLWKLVKAKHGSTMPE